MKQAACATYWFALLAGACVNAASLAQDGTAAGNVQPKDENAWRFRFTPGVWLPRLVGDVTLGPSGTELDFGDDLGLDDMEPNFTGSFTLGRGDWDFRFDAFNFSTDASTTFASTATFGPLTLDPGDTVNSSFEMTSVRTEIGYWAWQPCECGKPMSNGEPSKVDLFLGPVVGIRYIDVDQSLQQLGVGSVDTGGTWLGIYGGLTLLLVYDVRDIWPLVEIFEVGAAASLGPAIGGDGGFLYQVRAGLTAYFSQNVGFTFGYQIVSIHAENGEYELTGSPQGLFIGGTIKF